MNASGEPKRSAQGSKRFFTLLRDELELKREVSRAIGAMRFLRLRVDDDSGGAASAWSIGNNAPR